MTEEDCRGGNVLGKFVSYLHNYLGAPADAETEILGFNLFQKGLCLLRDCARGLSWLIKHMYNSFSKHGVWN